MRSAADPDVSPWRDAKGLVTTRGINYWASRDRSERRLLFSNSQFLQAIDARTGRSIPTFGVNGRVDLREGLDRDPARITVLWKVEVDAGIEGIPAVYEVNGRQHVVYCAAAQATTYTHATPAGRPPSNAPIPGAYVAFALPNNPAGN